MGWKKPVAGQLNTTGSTPLDRAMVSSGAPKSTGPKTAHEDQSLSLVCGVYEGGFADGGKREGSGVCHYPNGDVYEGNWQTNERTDVGTMYFQATGDMYTGFWKHDQMDGFGTYKYANGDVYEGQFHANARATPGLGTMRYGSTNKLTEGGVYTGGWRNSMRDAEGTMKWSDGRSYAGIWKEDCMEGKGIMTNPDGSIYEGHWKNNLMWGKGDMNYSNGDKYTGNWTKTRTSFYQNGTGNQHSARHNRSARDINAMPHFENTRAADPGTMVYGNGDKYVGQFNRNLQKEGKGDMVYADETKYTGNWHANYRGDFKEAAFQLPDETNHDLPLKSWTFPQLTNQQPSEINFRNGDIYRGEFQQGLPNGYGQMIFSGKETDPASAVGEEVYVHRQIYQGQWVDGQMTGQGLIKYPNGDKFQGMFKNGERADGEGKMVYLNGEWSSGEMFRFTDFYVGQWVDEQRNGFGKCQVKTDVEHIRTDNPVVPEPVLSQWGPQRFPDLAPAAAPAVESDARDTYEGEWRHNMMHGIGTYTFVSHGVKGNKYTGQFHNDKFFFNGKMEYTNGDVHEGEWFDNFRRGPGVTYYNNGDVFSGNWEIQMTGHNGTVKSEVRSDGEGKMVFAGGDIKQYEGEWQDEMFHGKGTIEYSNGDTYTGEFARNQKSGKGTLFELKATNRYVGAFEDDKQSGFGRMYYNIGQHVGKDQSELELHMYEGAWLNGKRDGDGTHTYPNGDQFKGPWKDGERTDGTGVFSFGGIVPSAPVRSVKLGSFVYIQDTQGTYQGEFKNEKRDGRGQMNYANGDQYEGFWCKDQKCGQGSMTYKNELETNKQPTYEHYAGEWKEDTFYGQGVLTETTGKFVGRFIYGQRKGMGVQTYANGDIFSGDWFADIRRDGPSKMSYSNGDVYTGQFIQEKQDGQGVLDYHDGSKYEGTFVKGVREGYGECCQQPGKYRFKNGDTYVGYWKADEFYGTGVLDAFSRRERYEGTFDEGKFHGKGAIRYFHPPMHLEPYKFEAFVDNEYFLYSDIFVGEFEHGKRKDGQGSIKYGKPANAEKPPVYISYEGQFVGECFNGEGKLNFTNENVYEGGFKHDRMHGQGKICYNALISVKNLSLQGEQVGDFFEGEFRFGQRGDTGTHLYGATGDIYSGNFFAGRRFGQGCFTYYPIHDEHVPVATPGDPWGPEKVFKMVMQRHQAKGKVDIVEAYFMYNAGKIFLKPAVTGIFEHMRDVEVAGVGKMVYANGDLYMGTFLSPEGKGPERNGEGKMIYKDGTTYQGTFVEDFFQGGGKHAMIAQGADYVNVTDDMPKDPYAEYK